MPYAYCRNRYTSECQMIGYLHNLYWRWRTRDYTWHAVQNEQMCLYFNRSPKLGWRIEVLPDCHTWIADGEHDWFHYYAVSGIVYVLVNDALVKHE